MSEKEANKVKKHGSNLIAVGIVLGSLVAIFLVAIVLTSVYQNRQRDKLNDRLKTARINTQQSEAEAIKSALDVYYVDKGAYPLDFSQIYNDATASKNVKSYVSDLKAFNYSATGDQKQFKFTYKDSSGQTHTVTGNYLKDYQ